jgi:hypothetical protein
MREFSAWHYNSKCHRCSECEDSRRGYAWNVSILFAWLLQGVKSKQYSMLHGIARAICGQVDDSGVLLCLALLVCESLVHAQGTGRAKSNSFGVATCSAAYPLNGGYLTYVYIH